MGKNTSISLGPHFEKFVELSLKSGRYNTASEVIRAALRLLEERDNKKQALRQALIEGEESGYVDNFSPEVFLEEMHKKHNIK